MTTQQLGNLNNEQIKMKTTGYQGIQAEVWKTPFLYPITKASRAIAHISFNLLKHKIMHEGQVTWGALLHLQAATCIFLTEDAHINFRPLSLEIPTTNALLYYMFILEKSKFPLKTFLHNTFLGSIQTNMADTHWSL